ncbi:unnamed protein product, partial [Sphacelaria rigidula]
ETEKRQRLLVAEAWNIQGWVSVGMHKLVQQTLRALVRYCTNPHAVRSVLWETREAAEFSAAARAASAAQRASDSREMKNTLRAYKKTVRTHKQDGHQAEKRRARAEDEERNRAADQVLSGLREATLAKSSEAKAHFKERRARALLLREEEDRRSTAYREEATILARETSKEAERVASAVLGRRVEEEEQAIAEVAVATAACEEEQTRSDGRNALFDAMMVREKDTHDR